MSTRSGKRIHSSFHENTMKPDVEHVLQSERKTRSKRCKENVEELSVSIVKTKKRTNYVSYPTDDELGTDAVDFKEEKAKPVRLLRKNGLKDHNEAALAAKNDSETDVVKPVRTTRRTCKLDAEENQENHAEEEANIAKAQKVKKEKKKKKSIPKEEEKLEVTVTKKKTKKKQKKRTSGSLVVEDIEPENQRNENFNKSNMSTDSFHSAAGSPLKCGTENGIIDTVTTPQRDSRQVSLTSDKSLEKTVTLKPEVRQTRSNRRLSSSNTVQNVSDSVIKASRKRKSSVNEKNIMTNGTANNVSELEVFDSTLTNVSKKRKSSINDTVTSKKNGDLTYDNEIKDSTFDLEDLEKRKSAIKAVLINTTFEKVESGNPDATFNKSEILNDKNATFEKETTQPNSVSKKLESQLNSTYEKVSNSSQIDQTSFSKTDKPVFNTTFEKDLTDTLKTSDVINTTYEKESNTDIKQKSMKKQSSIINSTYDKDDILSSTSVIEDSNTKLMLPISQKQSTELNSTFDKTESTNSSNNQNKKLDTTFEKSKTSLISSDNSNITLDKSETSRISITSDDSRENVVNSTPIILSNDPRISITSDESRENIINTTPLLIESSLDDSKINTSEAPKTPVTPLKREGTFTKEDSETDKISQSKSPASLPKTPTRKMSLPSPGCTPYPGAKSTSKVLNVTRSLEKSRRSSLAEPLPRATRVMFCSPVNNPAVVMQQRRKVIKSNLKGSNKSFVFEESLTEPRAAPRKRSYTVNDAEEARAKRTRLADSTRRTRTASAQHAAKPDTSKKATTPHKDTRVSRTKLPNFAALHRKEFSKMESLDECQQRKARRAKQLLTPTGAVTVLDRSSPRDNTTEKKTPTTAREQSSTREPKSDKSKKEKDKQETAKKEKDKPETAKKEKNPQEKSKKEQSESTKKEKQTKKPETPVKSLPTLRSLNPGYTRFGFKLNYDVNPFSIPTNANTSLAFTNKKNTVKKDNTKPLKDIKAMKRLTIPSLTGGSSRKEVAKQTIMREKSFTDKLSKTRNENRTVIKGVRTNRRFELQMRMRNIE